MSDLPEVGTGSVSLNLGTTSATAQIASKSEPPKSSINIPVLDHEEQISNEGVKDLVFSGADGGTTLLNQTNTKIWIGVMGVAVTILFVVFFMLARQTTLFQGNLISNLEEDIVTPNFEQSNQNSPISQAPVVTQEPGVQTQNPVPSTNNQSSSSQPSAEELLAQLLGNSPSDESVVQPPSTINSEEIVDPVIPSPVLDPEDPIGYEFNNTVTSRNEVNNNQNLATNVPIPGGSGVIIDTGAVSGINQNTLPSLSSNTNPAVLNSQIVQGDTGPGIILYFIAPFITLLIRRNVRKV